MILRFFSPVKKRLGDSCGETRQISYIFRILVLLVELYFGLLVIVGNFMHQIKLLESYVQNFDFYVASQNSAVFKINLPKYFFQFLENWLRLCSRCSSHVKFIQVLVLIDISLQKS